MTPVLETTPAYGKQRQVCSLDYRCGAAEVSVAAKQKCHGVIRRQELRNDWSRFDLNSGGIAACIKASRFEVNAYAPDFPAD